MDNTGNTKGETDEQSNLKKIETALHWIVSR